MVQTPVAQAKKGKCNYCSKFKKSVEPHGNTHIYCSQEGVFWKLEGKKWTIVPRKKTYSNYGLS